MTDGARFITAVLVGAVISWLIVIAIVLVMYVAATVVSSGIAGIDAFVETLISILGE